MDTAVVLISQPKIDFDTLKSILTNQIGSNIVSLVDQLPVTISQEAEFLIYVTALTHDIIDPLYTLKNLPLLSMSHLNYSMFIACRDDTLVELLTHTNLIPYASLDSRGSVMSLVTGSLKDWYWGITSNLLNKDILMESTITLLDMSMVELEKVGLEMVFGNFNKSIDKKRKLFYLESK